MRVTLHLTLASAIGAPAWCFLSVSSTAAQDKGPTIEQIVKVWEDRQSKVERARFEFSCTRTHHKGSTDFLAAAAGGTVTEVPNPPRDYHVVGKGSLSMDGEKLRHVLDMEQWEPETRSLYAQHRVGTFDGKTAKLLHDPCSGTKSYAIAGIQPAKKSDSGFELAHLPLTALVRGDPAEFLRNLAGYQLSPGTIQVGTRPCIELVKTSRTTNRREVLYLDSQRDYALVRRMTIQGDRPTWQLDVRNAEDAKVGWVPKSWDYVIRSPDAKLVLESGGISVTSYELNGKMPDDEFDIKKLPPGTVVRDMTSGKLKLSVIQEDGKKGGEKPFPVNMTYEELKQFPPSRPSWGLWWVVTGGLLLASGAAYFSLRGYQRYRRRQRSTSDRTGI
jgi:hypothetical protein